jgi:hypothetical protein
VSQRYNDFVTYAPSRVYVMKVYSKRALRWRSSSYPYLSADSFADYADVVYRPPRFRGTNPSLKDLKRARVIFLNSAELLPFLDDFGSSLEAKVIIAGNSDTEFHSQFTLPKSIKCLLLQNSFISDNQKVFTLPIGLENYRLGVNGDPRNITQISSQRAMPKTLFGPFGNTHPLRANVREEFLTASESWDFFEGYITPTDFNRLSAQYQYVACVRGNGIDTHRFWETLYRGRIPIVTEDNWSESLNHLNLPFEKISSWEKSELSRVMSKSFVQVQPRQISSLWMPYWLDFIKEKLS